MFRSFWIVAGSVSFALGAIGIFIPLLPTTPFMILAGFCWAKGSDRLYNWLLKRPGIGPAIKNWRDHGLIRLRAKVLATITIIVSLSLSFIYTNIPQSGVWGISASCTMVLIYIWSRPHRVVRKKEMLKKE